MSLHRTFILLLGVLAGSGAGAAPLCAQSGGEPIFAVHQQPAIPLVTIRMSLLVDDPPGLAGAGHLIQHLQYPALRNQAQAVGAQVRIERTADAIVYSITGPAAELHFLAGILRSTLQPPQAGAGARLTAERDLAEERLAEWETAGRHLRAVLRGRLFPGDLSAAGTAASAARLASEPLDALWARLYRRDRLAVLAVGDVDLADIRREFADLPADPRIGPAEVRVDTANLAPLAPPEATRGWFGAGYLVDDFPPAAVSVAARLLGTALSAQLPGSESVGEHWWTHHGQAIALVIAAPPQQLAAAPERLRTLPGDLLERLEEEHVTTAARAIRHDMLFYSRTPERMAEVVGMFIDRGGDADSAQAFYAELAEVGLEDVEEVLRHLNEAEVVRVTIPPQELNVSR